jgi:hypothetical protein
VKADDVIASQPCQNIIQNETFQQPLNYVYQAFQDNPLVYNMDATQNATNYWPYQAPVCQYVPQYFFFG